GQDRIAFKKDASGNWQFQMDWPFFIFQKVGLLENKHFNMGVLIFGLGIVVLTVLLWPVAAIARKHYQKPLDYTPSDARLRLVVRLVCILFVVFLGGWLTVVSLADSPSAINGLPPWIVLFGILGVLCTFGTVVVILNAFRSLGTPGRWFWTKLHDVLLAIACVALVWFAFTWNLMNFHVHY